MVTCFPQLQFVHAYLWSQLTALEVLDLFFYTFSASRNKSPHTFSIPSKLEPKFKDENALKTFLDLNPNRHRNLHISQATTVLIPALPPTEEIIIIMFFLKDAL